MNKQAHAGVIFIMFLLIISICSFGYSFYMEQQDTIEFQKKYIDELRQDKREKINEITECHSDMQTLKSRINEKKDKIYSLRTANTEITDSYQKMKHERSFEKRLVDMYENTTFFKRMMVNIAHNHDYVLDEYDCTQFSRDLVIKLRNHGWDAETVTSRVNFSDEENRTLHEFVHVEDVYIEAITGNIIIPSNYDRYGIEE